MENPYRNDPHLKDHHHLPRPSTKTFKSSTSRTAESRLHRLVTNHTLLRIHRHKMFPEQYSTPACDCGAEIQSIEHFLFNCTLIKDQIALLMDSIDSGFIKTATPHHRYISESVLLGEDHHLTPDMKVIVKNSMNTFLSSTLCHDI